MLSNMKVVAAALLLLPFVAAQRKSLIQELVSQIKSSPRHQSPSPSYTSERKFDVIGVGDLPLQTGRVEGPSQLDVITGQIGNYESSEERRDIASQDTQTLPFLAPLPVQLTGQLPSDEAELTQDPLESQGSSFISRPSVSHRRKQHNNGLTFRPLGEVISTLIRPNRNGLPPPRGPPRRRPSQSDRNFVNQDKVEEFFPSSENNRDHHRPERNDPRSKPPRRKPVSINIKNPFKNILDKSPLKKKKPKRPLKDGPFRPPSKVFKGFAPSFKGSLSLDEARKQHDRERYENEQFPTKFVGNPDQTRAQQPKRKRRRKPHRDGSKRPGRLPKRPNGHDFEMTNHPSHNDHLEEENFNRFAHDSTKPSLISDEMPGFGHNPTPGKRPDQDRLQPFEEEIAPFFPQKAERPGPMRPKRQRPRPTENKQPMASFQEEAFNDIPEDDLGFFSDVNFPDISTFGVGWDPKKIRKKRDAYEIPRYYKRTSKRPRLNRTQRPRRPSRQSSRRQGPMGFWDDPDFDADFFNGGSPTPQNFPAFESHSAAYPQPYYPQPQPSRPHHPRAGYSSQKIKQQARPKIVPKRYASSERYAIENTFNTNVEQDNSILGSGNFEILKGGTFYDKDDYLRPYSNNKPPSQASYYGDNNIFTNFRDFADIKGDAKQYNGYDEGYYYR